MTTNFTGTADYKGPETKFLLNKSHVISFIDGLVTVAGVPGVLTYASDEAFNADWDTKEQHDHYDDRHPSNSNPDEPTK